MARHGIRANRHRPEPETTIQAPKTFYEKTHPVGSAERFLDQAAKEALIAAAAGGLPRPRKLIPGAVRAVAKETKKKREYPDPLLSEAAELPPEELLRRAMRAEEYQEAMDLQNAIVDIAAAADTPVGNMVVNQVGAGVHDALTRQNPDAKGGDTRPADKSAETFDTPIPKELRARYNAWYAQLPKNLQYTGDYDLQGVWLERLGQPDKYEAAQNGHLDDYGKKPNHITFSTGSKWHDPRVPERTGGEWKRAKDGSWDFYPGTGNKASDDELKAYFEKYEKGNRVHGREVRQDAKGGDVADPETTVPETPVSEAPVQQGGPRIVINPTTFHNKKDAMCVAFNEAFRVIMESNGFEPVSEPTEKQRKFFSDTAYATDEVQLRRTILARICTFDTSVTDPTDEQLQEAQEFLNTVLEIGAPQNQWEQWAVMRIVDILKKATGEEGGKTPAKPEDGPANAAAGGGETDEEKLMQEQTAALPVHDADPRQSDGYAGNPDEPYDPRQSSRYVGDQDKPYDPTLDRDSDQFDRDKAGAHFVESFSQYIAERDGRSPEPEAGKQVGQPATEGNPTSGSTQSGGQAETGGQPAKDMSWDEIIAAKDKQVQQSQQRVEAAHADLMKTMDTAAKESQQRFIDANKTPGDGPAPAKQDEQKPAAEQAGAPQNPAAPDAAPVKQAGDQTPVQQDGQAQSESERKTTSGQRIGAQSGVWTGGEAGKGRQLTAREAEWLQQRAASGGRMNAQQKAIVASMQAQQAQQQPVNNNQAQPAGQPAQATPENQPEKKTTSGQRIGAQSGVWTGGAPGKGRQLTAREAEWMQQRAASGGRMNARQRALVASMQGQQAAQFGNISPIANKEPEDPLKLKRKKGFQV